MTLTQLQVFVTAAKAGSFTRAAEEIGFTQSAVSQMIQSLEKELGVSLFQRSRSGITPTSIGERMLSHARDILNITSCMTEEANVARGISSGTLRIASIPSVASRFLPGLLGSFRKRFPAVDILLWKATVMKLATGCTARLSTLLLPLCLIRKCKRCRSCKTK
ncbi:LysR family transcriptional regulator [Brevibacillus sp. AF8]|uniref:LysR family transcriptional regulator n=1 Tax=Brevibacillus sp. AF8 TaxID=2825881 RepID=UPI0021074B40|nr:LysR family transcriptional regulator [Brevibacillus sp. AF8]